MFEELQVQLSDPDPADGPAPCFSGVRCADPMTLLSSK